ILTSYSCKLALIKMASTAHSKLFMNLVVLLALTMASITEARLMPSNTGLSLGSRLKLDGESSNANCWESLFQLQACTGEVIMFFMNGETYLGPSCCQAIRIIEHDCWPEMLGSLGFTAEEGDILEGFCDAKAHSHSSPPSPPSVHPNTLIP
ncbi:egg cell-secreted protein 1.1-like, partial [Quillaja saponaria]